MKQLVHHLDTGHRFGVGGIDAADHSMGMGAAHDRRIELVWQVQVIGEAALAAQQHGILGARNRLADRELHICEISLDTHGKLRG